VENYRYKKKQKELDAQRKLDVEMGAICTDSQIEETPVKSKEVKDTARLDGPRVDLTITTNSNPSPNTDQGLSGSTMCDSRHQRDKRTSPVVQNEHNGRRHNRCQRRTRSY